MTSIEGSGVFDHLSLGVANLDASVALYDAALAPLGLVRLWLTPRAAGYGPPGFTGEAPFALVVPRERCAGASRAFHLAFRAPDRASVQSFHQAALGAGALDDGPPGIRENYGPGYYAAFVVDFDGHRIEAVVHEG